MTSDAGLRRTAEKASAAVGVAPEAVLRRARGDRRIVLARQVAMYIAVVVHEHRQRDVGRFFRRGRSVVGHNVRVIEDRRDDPTFDAWLEQLSIDVVG